MSTEAEFDGRVALVTGGASGIGRCAVEQLAGRGARVLVADLHEGELPEKGVLDGDRVRFRRTDISDPDDVVAMVADVVAAFGRLDIAVNNAGTPGTYAALPDQKLEDWHRTIAVNLTGVFCCLQAEIPAMLETAGGGAIVNTASDAGLMGFANLPAYVASKHGVIGLTKTIALEYGRTGIRVNAVCPGSVRTPMLLGFSGGDVAAMESMGKVTPMGRLGEPEEIAEAIVWLCSDAARYLTGVALPVDGGVMAT